MLCLLKRKSGRLYHLSKLKRRGGLFRGNYFLISNFLFSLSLCLLLSRQIPNFQHFSARGAKEEKRNSSKIYFPLFFSPRNHKQLKKVKAKKGKKIDEKTNNSSVTYILKRMEGEKMNFSKACWKPNRPDQITNLDTLFTAQQLVSLGREVAAYPWRIIQSLVKLFWSDVILTTPAPVPSQNVDPHLAMGPSGRGSGDFP